MQEAMEKAEKTKKDIYIIFLYVTKAFDKAWLEGIMYAMYNNGLKDKHWKVVNNVNIDLKAKIKTSMDLPEQYK